MRILQVTNGFPPTATAGVEQYTYQLSRRLLAHHDVRVFCRESAPQRADYDVLDGLVDRLPVRRVVNDFQHVSRIQDFYLDRRVESIFQRTLAEWQPDLIHVQHCIGLSASLLEVAAQARIPYLLTLHDYWFLCSRVQLLHRQGHICPGPIENVDCHACTFSSDSLLAPLKGTWLYRLLLSRLSECTKQRLLGALSRPMPGLPPAHRGRALLPYRERARYLISLLADTPLILTPSRFVRDLYARHGVPEARMHVLPLGLNLEPWRTTGLARPDSGRGLRVGYLGSILRHKGVDILVRAFQRLQAPEAILELHGFAVPTDPYGGDLQTLAGRDRRVKLMGRYEQKNLPAILSRLDLIAIPSLWNETFSIVAREALLSGTPVVASEVGALPEVIDDGRNGLLVPAGDVEALHRAIHRLSTDSALLARLREGALRSAEEIRDMADHVRDIEMIYQSLAARSPGSATP